MDWESPEKKRFSLFWNNLVTDNKRSVGFPLYRILVGVVAVPAILQLIYRRVPDSVAQATSQWYHYVFIVMQIIGIALILMSLAMGDTPDSAAIEMVGAIVFGGMCFIYFGIAWRLNGWGDPPLTAASWTQLGFGLFCIIRVYQIWKRLEKFKAEVVRIQHREEKGS